jgi:hypothetical protein
MCRSSRPGEQVGTIARPPRPLPRPLVEALVWQYGWQPDFWLDAAEKGIERGDVHYAQGCLYQAMMAMVQTWCTRDRAWILNEKGAVALAGGLSQSLA